MSEIGELVTPSVVVVEAVNPQDGVTVREKRLGQMRPDESGAAGDQRAHQQQGIASAGRVSSSVPLGLRDAAHRLGGVSVPVSIGVTAAAPGRRVNDHAEHTGVQVGKLVREARGRVAGRGA